MRRLGSAGCGVRSVRTLVLAVALAGPAAPGAASAATISGTVTDGASGLADVCVNAYNAAGPGAPPVGQTNTNTLGDGDYSFSALAPGAYKIEFIHCAEAPVYVREFYDDKPDFQSATVVDVTIGDRTDVNAVLVAGKTISGTVTGSDAPGGVEGICVNVQPAVELAPGQPPPPGVPGGPTSEGGGYTSQPLANGDYKVSFNDCRPSPQYVGEFYDDERDYQSATAVPVAGSDIVDIDAELLRGYTISGTVTGSDTGGDGIAGICVGVQTPSGEPNQPPLGVAGGMTDGDGHYTTGPAPPGSHRLAFNDCQNRKYVQEFWNDKPDFQSADPVVVVDANLTGKDAELQRGHSISGKITGSDTGSSGVQGICVQVQPAVTVEPGEPPPPPVAFAQSGEGGVYSTQALADGDYKLQFFDCRQPPGFPDGPQYVSEFYDDKPDHQSADTVTVAGGDVLDIDAELLRGHTIAGTVTGSDTDGAGIAGICVGVQAPPAAPDEGPLGVAFGMTDGNGDYTTSPVAPGTYRLNLHDCSPPNQYVAEYFDDKDDFWSADPLTVVNANLTDRDAVLERGHTISGTVTGTGAAGGISGICVNVLDATSGEEMHVGFAFTGPGGTYTTNPLGSGTYKLGFHDCRPAPVFLPEFWNDKDDFASADEIAITTADVTDRNAFLELGRTISGHVSGAQDPDGVEGICVSASNAENPEDDAGGTETDGDGDYTLLVAPGQYRIRFGDCRASPTYIGEWWDDEGSFDLAQVIDVTVANASGKDAVLAVGHTISGRVTSDGVNGLGGICVGIVSADDEDTGITGADTDESGDYRTEPIADGEYKINFSDCEEPRTYISEWWDGKPDFGSADPVSVAGADVSGKDAVLAVGRTISGRVTSGPAPTGASTAPTAVGDGIPNVCVGVVRADEEVWVQGADTDADGDYTTGPLPPGSYKLNFTDCNASPAHVSEWWDDKPDHESADAFEVGGSDVTGKNAVLTPGNTVSGQVTDGQDPLPGVCVNLFSADDRDAHAGGTGTGDEGAFAIPALPGRYKVEFSHECGPEMQYVREWFDDAPSFDGADEVDLTAADQTIDAVLTLGGAVAGTVRSGSGLGGTALESMCVNAYQPDGPGESASTGADGTYRVGGLPSGTYSVAFEDCREDQSAGAYRRLQVDGVVVSAPGTTTGIDAFMGELDTTVPQTFITSGPAGTTAGTSATFLFVADESPAGFGCSLDGGDMGECASPMTFSGLADGQHTFTVSSCDTANHCDESPATRTWTVASANPPSTETTSGSLPPAGGTVSDDPLGAGASVTDPITTSVTAPGGGDVTIIEGPATGPAPPGFSFFGRQAQITSSVVSSATNPLRIAFTIDASLIPAGTALGDVHVFRDGAAVPDCTSATSAAPDPCVLSRESLDGGDVRLTVLTGQASTWNVGRRPPATPAAPPVAPPPVVSPPPLVAPQPGLRIATRRGRVNARRRTLTIRLVCSGAACRGRLTVRARVRRGSRRRTLVLGSKAFAITPGRTGTVTIRLSRNSLRALRRARRLRATATARVRGIAAPVSGRVELTLRRR